jgi:hypothetical protein
MKTGKRVSRTRRKGLVLPLVIMIGVCLALLGLGLIQLGFGSRLMAALSEAGITARTAADAGLTRALYEMNSRFVFGTPPDNTWLPYSSGVVHLEDSNARFQYWIDPPFTDAATGERYWRIKSTGTSGREVKTVYALAGLTNLFDYGLIVTNSIDLKQSTLVDGYSSARGAYGGTNRFGPVKIGTTYAGDDPMIILRNNVRVTGDVLVGVGGDVDQIISALGTPGPTTGPRYNLPEPWEFQPIIVTVPPTVPSSGVINNGSAWSADGDLVIGTPGTHTYWLYDSITVPTSRRLVFQGQVDLHITGDLNLGANATLYVGGDPLANPPIPPAPSSLIIYLDGALRAGNSNGINNLSRIPANFRLFGTGQPTQSWNIQNSGDFYGVYYAPNADINIYAKGEVFGSVSGWRFVLKADPGTLNGLHYDVALSDLHQYDTGFGIDRWWETVGP